jgi:type VI secretion system protein ImpA
VHPLLDEADGNDPQERVNALNNLAAPMGTDGDLLRVLQELRRIPLVESPQSGRFTLAGWLAVKGLAPWTDANGEVPTEAILEGTRTETEPEKLAANAAAAAGCLQELATIAKLFATHAGEVNSPTFEPLRKDLKQVVAWIGQSPEEEMEDGNGAAPHASRSGNPGDIRSREDVLKALDAIIQYYRTHEPSSPVPFLLQRVKRVVPMNFMDLMRDLSPESLDRLVMLTGPVDGPAAS